MLKQMTVAAELMDEALPGWHNKIDVSRLNMQSSSCCIAGQCGLRWGEMTNLLFERLPLHKWDFPHGGVAPFASRSSAPFWVELIEERKRFDREVEGVVVSAADQAPVPVAIP